MSDEPQDLDIELLRAEEVARILKKPVTTVYSLPIPRVELGKRSVRWKPSDVMDYIQESYTGDDEDE